MGNGNKIKKVIKRVIVGILIFVVVIAASLTGYVYYYASKLNKSSNIDLGELNDMGGIGAKVQPIEAGDNEPVNILVLGIDEGSPNSTNKNDPKRSDTIMVVHYDPNTKQTNIISIPRDTMVTLKVNGKNTTRKINDAHFLGGVNLAIDTVQKLLNIKINYYGKLNNAAFREIVDAIGGIDMDVPFNMDYDDPAQDLHIHIAKGNNVHLDGAKAEGYFRWRKNNDGTNLFRGDLDRIDNQHVFISKVIDKFKSPVTIAKVPEILDIIQKNCDTNMDAKNILRYGWIFVNSDKSTIKMSTVKGTTPYIDRISYFQYQPSMNKDILNILHSKNK